MAFCIHFAHLLLYCPQNGCVPYLEIQVRWSREGWSMALGYLFHCPAYSWCNPYGLRQLLLLAILFNETRTFCAKLCWTWPYNLRLLDHVELYIRAYRFMSFCYWRSVHRIFGHKPKWNFKKAKIYWNEGEKTKLVALKENWF